MYLIDESHNSGTVRPSGMKIWRGLLLKMAEGREGARKKIILLTATPINNDLFDLYNQINLLTQGIEATFPPPELGPVSLFLECPAGYSPRKHSRPVQSSEEIVVRRTRAFIRRLSGCNDQG